MDSKAEMSVALTTRSVNDVLRIEFGPAMRRLRMGSMSEARFKDLVLDAADVRRSGAFWAAATGLALTLQDGGDGILRDGIAEHVIWVNAVPEPRSVKQRVHLDLFTGSVAALEALGATVEEAYAGWTVMRDPEGGELCAFPRDPVPAYRVYELVVDAADPETIAGWWADRFGIAARHDPSDPWWWLEPEAGTGLPWPLVFNPVPEPKRVKNRIHWDVWGSRERLVAAGARLLRARDEEIGWDVLADPEGNEFCVFTPRG